MSNSKVDIIDKGMSCLIEKLGVVETEQFISVIMREEFNQAAVAYGKEHPFNR